MNSSVFNYLYDGVTDTYKETIDYWSQDNSASDAVDVVEWSVENPLIVKKATIKGIGKSSKEFKTALNQDTNKLLLSVAAIAVIYFYMKGKK